MLNILDAPFYHEKSQIIFNPIFCVRLVYYLKEVNIIVHHHRPHSQTVWLQGTGAGLVFDTWWHCD